MPTGTYNHPLFGLVTFKTVASTWTFGGEIVFTAGFDTADVISFVVPQLKSVEGGNGGKVKFHKRGKNQLLAAFEDIERLGLLKHIRSTAGAFNQRLKKPPSGKLSKQPSNHSFGIAVDLNSDDGCDGCTTAPLEKVFTAHGFLWGDSFNDPMHYEVEKFIDDDEPAVKDVTVFVGNKNIDIGAKSIFGDLFALASKIDSVPGLKVNDGKKGKLALIGPKSSKVIQPLNLGGVDYLPLPQSLGVAMFTTDFDNRSKLLRAMPLTLS